MNKLKAKRNGHSKVKETIETSANGHGTGEQLTETEVVTTTPKPMLRHSWEVAMNAQEGVNSLKPLFEAGENPIDLLMRSIIGNMGSDEYILMVALSEEMAKCRELGDEVGEMEVRDLFAMMPSLQGRGREQYVSAIIGQFYKTQEGIKESRLHRIARNGFGSPPDEK